MSVPITAIYAGLCGLLAVVLANNVLYFRMRARRQPEWRPEAVLRVCRLLHAFGMSLYAGANYPRLIGAQGTFLLISAMSVALLYAGLIA